MSTTSDTYLTISGDSEGLYKEKGSKFIAYAFPVKDEEEVKEKVELLKKQYYDARHHCYAYIIGAFADQYRANDDGEPNHSAGDPILGQIRSRNLTNTLVVVIRYFGGIKLGVSGLITAYKTASADALDQNEVKEELITRNISIQFEYPDMNDIMRIVKELDAEIVDQEMQLNCKMTLAFRLNNWQQAYDRIELLRKINILDPKQENQ